MAVRASDADSARRHVRLPLALPLEWAILIGAGLGLLIHVIESTQPRIELRQLDDGGELVAVGAGDRPRVAVVEVSGHLHYAAIRRFLVEVEARVPEDVVIDLSHAHTMRYAALMALEELDARARKHGGKLVLAGVSPSFAEMIRQASSELVFYPYDPVPARSARHALNEHEPDWSPLDQANHRHRVGLVLVLDEVAGRAELV